ncbi:MAG: hypothetical protein Q9P01_01670 [Anaerolineae bacterium]|nr:hypothetical protein [Anaerolineae bacterium]MDQ7033570.1 hypothetical protein [Anaerolineae bacterium]
METVSIRHIDNIPALFMVWDADIKAKDVSQAYQQITTELDQSETLKYIIVDLTSNPNMPFAETLRGALYGPYKHPMLKQWLVVGDHQVGHMVSRLLFSTTGKKHVIWFDSIEDAYDHIENEVEISGN